MATRRTKRTKKTTKRSPKKSTKKSTRKRTTKSSKKPAKKTTKKAAKKKPAKKAAKKTAVGTKAPKLRRPPPKSTEDEPSEAAPKKTKGKSTKRARSSAKTVPGGSTPPMDDVTIAKRALRDLREVLARVGDGDAELILGDGALDRLIGAIVPPLSTGATAHEHLAAHKRRASLLARLRHGVNERSAYAIDGTYVSPTRVQWFYDGLTFLEGDAPYEGVVGLFRDGVVRHAMNVIDASRDETLGPLEADFVSLAEARRAFRGAGSAEGLAALEELSAADDPEGWITWLIAHPWALGAQHANVERVVHRDEALPKVTAKRSTDGAQDVLLVESPHTAIVGKTGRVLSSFRDVWLRAEQQRMFVQRQTGYLKRELGWKIRDPRFIILAGRALTKAEREIVREELERHHASIRLVTFDELAALARRTLAFFEPRL